jgi:signal transduction histidine kinase
MKGSFRLNLILWNVGVLAVSLIVFSFISGWISISTLRKQIDQELMARASGPAVPFRGAPGPPMGSTGPGQLQGIGSEGVPSGGSPFPDRRAGPGGGPPNPPRANNDPFFDLRRPRIFDETARGIDKSERGKAFDLRAVQRSIQGESIFTTIHLGPERLRVFTKPLQLPNHQPGAIQVGRELRDVDLLQAGQIRTLLVLLPISLVAAAIGAVILTRSALKPIGELQLAASGIASGELDQRLKVRGNDEFASLAGTFNDMSEKLQASFLQLNNAYDELEKAFERQRQFTADASHEMRTPLARLRLATSSALVNPEADYLKSLTIADQAAESLGELVEQLLVLAKADSGSMIVPAAPIDLRLSASDAILAVEATTGRIIGANFPDQPIPVLADASSIQRVVQNLLLNSVRHTPTGEITLSIMAEGSHARMEVGDQGEGIDEADLPRVFERFYRADRSRTSETGGTGLGLAICKEIVEAYRGSIAIHSRRNVGSVVTILLPIFKSS